MNQKEIFLKSEADSWYIRNRDAISKRLKTNDPIYLLLENLLNQNSKFNEYLMHKSWGGHF
jgi:hypothetical protein